MRKFTLGMLAKLGIPSTLAMLGALLLAGCDDGGGGGNAGDGHDFGANDPNVYVAIGDSITANGYPPILASMLGKPVINRGGGGTGSGDGAAETPGILSSYKPGYLLILYGANDVTHGRDADAVIGNLRNIIEAAKANKTVPVIATLTPMLYEHEAFHVAASDMSAMIRKLASEEGVPLADLEAAFNDQSKYMSADGLHPNDAGNQLVAATFFDVLN